MKSIKALFTAVGMVALMVTCVTAPVGCNRTTLAPGGAYAGDQVLYQADKTITTTYKQFQAFLAWELKHRPMLPVEVSHAADTIRLNAKKWIDSASSLRETYAASGDRKDRDNLVLGLNLISTALNEAVLYMAQNQAKAPNEGLNNVR
jgi:hypothetical protein